MQYRRLGRTDIEVSAVAMGCWGIAGGGTWGQSDDDESVATIRAALDAGVTFFDTAEGYGRGRSEELLGRALEGRRDEAVIATKVSRGNLAADGVKEACERSLAHLGTDRIDLYQMHWPSRKVPFAETMRALEDLVAEGKVRALGVSNFALGDLTDLLAVARPETDQLPYSLIWRAIEFDVVGKCVESNVGILCYSPVAQGLLADRFATADDVPEGRARTRHFSKDRPQARHAEDGCERETFEALSRIREICSLVGQPMSKVAIAWLLHRPGVTSVLAGARRPEQARENAAAAELALGDDVVDELTRATDEVKRILGANPDPWMSESRMR